MIRSNKKNFYENERKPKLIEVRIYIKRKKIK